MLGFVHVSRREYDAKPLRPRASVNFHGTRSGRNTNMTTIRRIVLVGFGNIGQGLLPLLDRHFQARTTIFDKMVTSDLLKVAREYSAELIECRITPENYRTVLAPLLDANTALLNFAVSVSSVDLIRLAQENDALYIDSCIEPWEYGCSGQGLLESNYGLRESIQAMRTSCAEKATALVAHGANPGFISILLKKALYEMARSIGLSCEPTSRDDWANLARTLDIRVIQISERDTQVESIHREPDEFVCTWSVDGFITECLQAAELGWGSHEEQQIPSGATLHCSKTQSVLELATRGKDTRVKSWSPNYLGFEGYLLTHNESLSIAEYLTVLDGEETTYRPTVFYAYHPCDATVESLPLLADGDEERVASRRVIKDGITSGIDELGIFLVSGTHRSFWLGSNLSIGKARKMAAYNNATSLQVVSSVVAALKWMEGNPRRGVIESEEVDWEFIYEMTEEYWKPMSMESVAWQPDKHKRELIFQEFVVNSHIDQHE